MPNDEEMKREIETHLELEAEERIEEGLSADAARAAAQRAFGNALRTREDVRAVWSWAWLREIRQDAMYGVRMLTKDRGFTAVAIVTLALGIGANSAMFAVADATLLRPLPFPDPDRLVMISEIRRDGSPGGQINPLDLVDWIERNRSFEAMAAVLAGQSSITGADGTAELVNSQAVTTRFFDVLGIKPFAGRTFVAADDEASRVVVLGEAFWRRHFGGDPTVIGGQIRLGGQMLTAIGIVPSSFQLDTPGFTSSGPIGVWTVQGHPRGRGPAERYPHYLPVIGRLKPGVTLEAARSEMASLSDALAAETPATNTGHRATVDPLRERLTSQELRLTSLLLMGVVGFVLLMCCANVATLLLARTGARARELAVRSALGAGRARIVRQLLTESLLLAAVGGGLGMAVGAAMLRVAPSLVPTGLLPTVFPLVFDLRVLTFCLLTTFVVAIVSGLAPAWQATGKSIASLDTRTSTGAGSRLRRGLAIAEVAVAVLLLCGAGLLLRTLLTLEDVDAGIRAGELLTTRISPGMDKTPDAMRQFYAAVEREVRSSPGVRDVAWGSALPLERSFYGQSFEIDGDPPRPQGDRDSTGYQIVGPNYFRLLGVSVLDGRECASSTKRSSVAI
jgi:putative ABC transport system permease protein